jgi:hypothetical protein
MKAPTHRDSVAHLVDEDQQHESGREEPAPLHRVGADGEQHRREGLELDDAGEEAEKLRLAEDEEQAGPGGARRRLGSVRPLTLALSRYGLEALIHRPQVFDLAGAARGLVGLGHDVGSLIGRGMNQASYMMIPRKTSFMIPKFAAITW